MKTLSVNLKDRSYNIHFEYDFSGLANCLSKINAPKKMLLVTDTNVFKLYAEDVVRVLKENGYDISTFVFNAGEQSKNLQTISDICRACIEYGLDRKSMILALGGGVVGDMVGFAASIYMRGIDYVQIPTTLLSQSDSSVGGKTGVDFMGAKNILGAFHQPKAVYINVSAVKTLPKREFISGMGEIIKHGIIRDSKFFDFLFENSASVNKLEKEILLQMAYTNCLTKADVVSKDEFENGLRADLNFGHTFGHAIESAYDFQFSHGECVGLGMICASYISYKRDILKEYEFKKIEEIIK